MPLRVFWALLAFSLQSSLVCCFSIASVQHRPTYDEENGDISPPVHLAIAPMQVDPKEDLLAVAYKTQSKFTYIGCFQADTAITRDTEQGSNFDPNDCIEVCQKRYATVPIGDIIVAVHAERCGCVINDFLQFKEANAEFCTFGCKFFDNPLCGGAPDYWGVYKEYDEQSLSSQGAYDPWRSVWYTVVVVREATIRGFDEDGNVNHVVEGVMPERYYLHAASTNGGEAVYPYHTRLPGIIHGLQFDIDSTRLVGLFTEAEIGRTIQEEDWQYRLIEIYINNTVETYPVLKFDDDPSDFPLIPISMSISKEYMLFTGTSAIMSMNGRDALIFTQLDPKERLVKNNKDRLYIVSVPDGAIIFEQGLDFRVLQILVNEMYGDISAIGPRLGEQQYTKLGRITKSEQEGTKLIDWQYNSNNPILIAPADEIKDLSFYPGLSCSEHMFNKSIVAFKKYPDVETDAPRLPNETIYTVMDIDIRENSVQRWCGDPCMGSAPMDVPYAGLFNREPRIPLTLQAPSFKSARFTIEAGEIMVEFDRSTLQGAIPISTDGDIVPDEIDFSTQQIGKFDCAEIFDDTSAVSLLPKGYDGDAKMCEWQSESLVKVSLLGDFMIAVGESLFPREGVIFTRPRNGEYSMSASGGIPVAFPDPLEPPQIQESFSEFVDECAPVEITAESYFTGRKATYSWALDSWQDMTNRPDRPFNMTKIANVQAIMEFATEENLMTLNIPPAEMEPATAFFIILNVTSRWGLTSSKTLTVQKRDFPAPMVSIIGKSELLKARADPVNLVAKGEPSSCSGTDRKLGYRWTETSGKLDMQLLADNDITTTAKQLLIKKFILEPAGDKDFINIYNFTVECFVASTPNKASYASVSVGIKRSPIFVALRAEDRQVSRGRPLVLDARVSKDPDYPTIGDQTFRGQFKFACLDPERMKCFSDAGPNGELGDPDTGNLQTCITNKAVKFVDGGKSFTTPTFDGQDYCKYTTGVLMVSTNDMQLGEYKFDVSIKSPDGREASKSVMINITEQEVVQSTLEIVNPEGMAKYPNSLRIDMEGVLEGDVAVKMAAQAVSKTFSWEILIYDRNPDWIPEVAADNERKGIPYRIDEMRFRPDSLLDTGDSEKFVTSPETPTFSILPNVLMPGRTYKVKMLTEFADGTKGEGFKEFTMAGPPPTSGNLTCEPLNATMDTPRVISAPKWIAQDAPLSYYFGYFQRQGPETIIKMGFDVKLQTYTMQVDGLELGDADANFALQIFVEVSTIYGATTTEVLEVYSRIPDDADAAMAGMLENLEDLDPDKAVDAMNQVASILDAGLAPGETPNAEQTAIVNQLLDNMESGEGAKSPEAIKKKAGLLSKLVDKAPGPDQKDKAMGVMEGLVGDGVNSDPPLFASDNDAAQLALNLMGAMLPGEGGDDYYDDDYYGGDYYYRRLKAKDDEYKPIDPLEEWFGGHFLSTYDKLDASQGRQLVNHPPVRAAYNTVIKECKTAYCDRKGLLCTDGGTRHFFRCCEAANPMMDCDNPPCWFYGMRCPDPPDSNRRLKATSSLSLPPPSIEGDYKSHMEDFNWRNLLEDDGTLHTQFAEPCRNTTDLMVARRLQGIERPANLTREDDSWLIPFEDDEKGVLMAAQKKVKRRDNMQTRMIRADARKELKYSLMDPQEANMKRKISLERREKRKNRQMQRNRNISQLITRMAVMRDIVCKQIIAGPGTMKNAAPTRFPTSAFIIYMGKCTNLSKVSDAFIFPPKFIVPADSPDEPTEDNKVTGFAFIYVKYKRNIYSWSRSAPPANKSDVITLIAMKANTYELDITNEPNAIRVFANYDLLSSGLCMYWDRFAPDTAGGAWSSKGIVNDGTGCLTTHLSDMGLFIDGIVPVAQTLTTASAYYLEELVDRNNFVVVASLGFVLLLNLVLTIWGYKRDETFRENQRRGKSAQSQYHLDGDGLTSARSIDDPIAYKYAHIKSTFFLRTFLNVARREHAAVGPFFYHETFTRPQRLLSLGALIIGIMAFNSAVYGTPNQFASSQQYAASGVLSSLLAFPIYCMFMMMFSLRPTPSKKRLLKQQFNPDPIKAITEERMRLERASALMPPKAPMLALPPSGTSGPAHTPGGYAILGALPLPGIMPKGWSQTPPPSLALPPPPGIPFAPPAIGPGAQMPVAGLPALPYPALGMAPKAGQGGLPPPPRYPPPAMYAKQAAPLPPIFFGRSQREQEQMMMGRSGPQAVPALPGSGTGLGNPGSLGRQLPPPPPPPSGPPPGNPNIAHPQLGSVPFAQPGTIDGEVPPAPSANFMQNVKHNASPPEHTPENRDPEAGAQNPEIATQNADSSPTNRERGQEDAATAPPAPPVLDPEASHQMMPPGNLPPPPPPPPLPKAGGPPGVGMPGVGMVPPVNIGGVAPWEPNTPTATPPISERFLPQTPKGLPPMIPGVINNVVPRGEPPMMLPPPFDPTTPGYNQGQQRMMMPMQGMPPGMPPMPGGMAPPMGPGGMPPPVMPVLGPVPPPPPPPKEDDASFVRRVRLTYMTRTTQEAEKINLLEDDPLRPPTPPWVFSAAAIAPYVACGAFTAAGVFVVLMYGIKFARWQEEHWYYASLIGLGMILFVLDVVRISVMTIVELRKYEIRRRRKAGDFLVSRIRKGSEADDDTTPAALRTKPKRPHAKAPPVPFTTPGGMQHRNPVPRDHLHYSKEDHQSRAGRPDFLPEQGSAEGGLPVAPPPPPAPPGQGPPIASLGGSMPRGAPPPPPPGPGGKMPSLKLQGKIPSPAGSAPGSERGQSLLPGKLSQGGRNSPSGSVQGLNQSLNDSLKGRAGGKPPPPPRGPAGANPNFPPPGPPGSSSHRSSGSGASRGPASGRPPSGSMQQSRSAARAQQPKGSHLV